MSKPLNQLIRVGNIIEEGRVGGPQLRMIHLANALDKKIDITLILPKKNSEEFQKRCELSDIKYLVTSLTTLRRKWIIIFKYFFLFPFEILKLSIMFKRYNFDVVHVSGGCWQIKGVIAAKLAGIKVIWELNDTYMPKFIRIIFFLTSGLANIFIYASHQTQEYYKKLVPATKASFVIQSPVDTNFFDPTMKYQVDNFFKKNDFRKKIVVGIIGNINPVKGHTTFLKAAKKLSKYGSELVFIIVGEIYDSQMKYFKKLKDLIKINNNDNIYFVGYRNDIRSMLKAIDIYVCSSNYESSPLSVWEAMAMEKAIVSTNVGYVQKFIKNGTNGFIIDVKDDIALAESILKLSKNPDLRNSFGKSAREIATSKLNLKICADLNYDVYKAAMC